MSQNTSHRAFPASPAKAGEPWVELADGTQLADWSHDDEVIYNQVSRQEGKVQMFRRTFDFLTGNHIAGDYYEFGCHRCRTFRMALTEARKHALTDMKFYAFDSFEGLPQPTTGPRVAGWQAGMLKTDIDAFMGMVTEHGIFVKNVEPVKGYYDESLTPALQRRLLNSGRKIALATIDCDLYESAQPVFAFMEPLLQEGTVIYMDDLFSGYAGNPTLGVARAFLEWQQTSQWKIQRHLDVGAWGRTYICYKPDVELQGVI
jgi:O-methyltransferase